MILSVLIQLARAEPPTDTEARTKMVRSIRAEVRRAAPDADDAFMEDALRALAATPREAFIASADRPLAYKETPLPIGHEQTISDPYIVAVMTAAAHVPAQAAILDIGTGSGFQAAVLAKLTDQVFSIEIVPELATSAQARLQRLGYRNVTVRAGDGFGGWPERAPFDAVIVAAGADRPPQPLLDQLKVGGRLVMPIGTTWANEQILVFTRTGAAAYARCSLGWSMFVPLTGAGARAADTPALRDRGVPLCYSGEVARPYFAPAPTVKRD